MHTACSLSQIPDRSSTQMFTIDCCMWRADRWCVLVESAASVRPVIDWAPAAGDVGCCSLYCGGWWSLSLDLLIATPQSPTISNPRTTQVRQTATRLEILYIHSTRTLRSCRASEVNGEHWLSLVKGFDVPMWRYAIKLPVCFLRRWIQSFWLQMNERVNDWMDVRFIFPIGAPGDVISVLLDVFLTNMNVCSLHSYMAAILLTHVKESTTSSFTQKCLKLYTYTNVFWQRFGTTSQHIS